MISARRNSAHDISLYGVATLKKVEEKNILVSCRMVKVQGFVRETNEVRLKQEADPLLICCMHKHIPFAWRRSYLDVHCIRSQNRMRWISP